LSLTQPALTRSLQSLERDLGARLFDRDRTRVEPTPVGERLIERARLLVSQARSIEQDLQQMLGLEVGLLRIGAGPYPADLSVGSALGRFVKSHPQVMVDLSVADWPALTRRILASEIELAVADVGLAGQDERLVVELLGQHQAYLFCRRGHPLA
jgi:DNA-binding transcriptional LysR family regulator